MNERWVKAIGIYSYNADIRGREEGCAPHSLSGARTDRGLTFLITWLLGLPLVSMFRQQLGKK